MFFERVFKEQVKVYCLRERGEGLIRESKNSFVKNCSFAKEVWFHTKCIISHDKIPEKAKFCSLFGKMTKIKENIT